MLKELQNRIRNWKIFSKKILSLSFSERVHLPLRRNLSDLCRLFDYWLLA